MNFFCSSACGRISEQFTAIDHLGVDTFGGRADSSCSHLRESADDEWRKPNMLMGKGGRSMVAWATNLFPSQLPRMLHCTNEPVPMLNAPAAVRFWNALVMSATTVGPL